jgi:molybdopterin-guanine dinucleotide biosynthesis protein A
VAIYADSTAVALRAALESGVRSLRGGLERLRVEWLDDAVLAAIPGGAACLLNVNTPDDLRLAAERLAAADAEDAMSREI